MLRGMIYVFVLVFACCLHAEDIVGLSDPAADGFLHEVVRSPAEVGSATSMVATVNGVWRSIGESCAIALRSDSFRALTIHVR